MVGADHVWGCLLYTSCLWLRARIDRDLAAGGNLLVMGDLNDGPGLDEYEKLFGHSGVEVVLGLSLIHI